MVETLLPIERHFVEDLEAGRARPSSQDEEEQQKDRGVVERVRVRLASIKGEDAMLAFIIISVSLAFLYGVVNAMQNLIDWWSAPTNFSDYFFSHHYTNHTAVARYIEQWKEEREKELIEAPYGRMEGTPLTKEERDTILMIMQLCVCFLIADRCFMSDERRRRMAERRHENLSESEAESRACNDMMDEMSKEGPCWVGVRAAAMFFYWSYRMLIHWLSEFSIHCTGVGFWDVFTRLVCVFVSSCFDLVANVNLISSKQEYWEALTGYYDGLAYDDINSNTMTVLRGFVGLANAIPILFIFTFVLPRKFGLHTAHA